MSEAERSHCDAQLREESRRNVSILGLVVGSAMLVAFLIEMFAVRLPGWHEHVSRALPAQIAACWGTSLGLTYVPFLRRHAIAFSLLMISTVLGMGGWLLGGLGGFDGPFFYSVYIAPVFIMVVPCGLGLRIASTLFALVCFMALFALQQPLSGAPSPEVTLHTLFIVSSASILLGHKNTSVSRERFLAMYRLDADREQMRVRNTMLLERFRDQAAQAESLARELSGVKSEERVSLARNLHDDVGQILVGAKMELAWLERAVSAGSDLEADQMSRLYGVMDTLEGSIRNMIRELRQEPERPRHTTRLAGLVSSVPEHVTLVDEVDRGLFARLPEPRAELVYRVLQEGMTNAAKYAHATTWRWVLEIPSAGELHVAVIDDGPHDFDPASCEGGGWGLPGLRERAQALGGTLSLRREAGQTVLDVRLPDLEPPRMETLT